MFGTIFGCVETNSSSENDDSNVFSVCENIDCSGNGICSIVPPLGEPICSCDSGFHAEDLDCVVDQGSTDICADVTCSGQGSCAIVGGDATCNCDDGYFPEDLSCIEPSAVYTVSTVDELEATLTIAVAGSLIFIEDGTYSDEIHLLGSGLNEQPITIRARNPGNVIFTNKTLLEGSWLTLDGIQYSGANGHIEIASSSSDVRVTSCHFNDSQADVWFYTGTYGVPGAMRVELDNCIFENKTNNTTGPQRDRVTVKFATDKGNEAHLIHDNLFLNIPRGNTSNGFEVLQLISASGYNQPVGPTTNIVVANNTFDNAAGENEIISVKNHGTTIVANKFLNCVGTGIRLRYGNGSRVINNVFSGMYIGVFVNGENHEISGNYFYDTGFVAVGLYVKSDQAFEGVYRHVRNLEIKDNYFEDNERSILVYDALSGDSSFLPLDGLTITNNEIIVGSGLFAFGYNADPINDIYSGNIVEGTLGIEPRNGIATGTVTPITFDEAIVEISE